MNASWDPSGEKAKCVRSDVAQKPVPSGGETEKRTGIGGASDTGSRPHRDPDADEANSRNRRGGNRGRRAPSAARRSSGHGTASRRLQAGWSVRVLERCVRVPTPSRRPIESARQAPFQADASRWPRVQAAPRPLATDRWVIVQDGMERVDGVLARESALARCHLEQHRSQREEIRPAINGASTDLFRRQVAGRPEQHARQRREAVGPAGPSVSLAIPKSRILVTPDRVRKTLSGFKSR